MTQKEKLIVSAHTGILMCDMDSFHKYIEEVLGRQVWTHELGFSKVWDEIREKTKEDFIKLCESCEEVRYE